jgi:hypothetical protein
MTLNTYQTATLIAAIDSLRSQGSIPARFFKDNFFPDSTPQWSQTILYDLALLDRRLAPFVHPDVEAKIVQRKGFVTKSIVPAYIKELVPLRPSEMLDRGFGEALLTGMAPIDRADNEVSRQLIEAQRRVDRRLEWMCIKALRDGKITLTGDGYPSTEVDFGRDATLQIAALSGAADWLETTSDPRGNLATWAGLVVAFGAQFPDQIVMAPDAYTAFVKHADVKSALDTRNITGNTATTGPVPGLGAKLMGEIDGFSIWQYQQYLDGDPAMESGMVIGVSTGMEGSTEYGAIQDFRAPGGSAPVKFFPKIWQEENPSILNLMIQSAPLTVPKVANASFCSLDVLG